MEWILYEAKGYFSSGKKFVIQCRHERRERLYLMMVIHLSVYFRRKKIVANNYNNTQEWEVDLKFGKQVFILSLSRSVDKHRMIVRFHSKYSCVHLSLCVMSEIAEIFSIKFGFSVIKFALHRPTE